MRNKCIHSVASITVLILNLIGFNAFSQVGIGTLNPNENALLELDATARPGGLLLPRLALTATNSPAPLVDPVPAGMTVYNTATMGTAPNEVTPGLYYHNGTNWVRMDAANGDGPDNKWKLTGNAGTTPETHFIGTTDNVSFQVKTNNAARFDFTNNGRLRSYDDGLASQPTYSWNGANGQNMGMFRAGINGIGFSTNSTERFRIPQANQVHALHNGTAELPFYSWASNSAMGMYGVGTNILGFSTTSQERIRILANGDVGLGTNNPLARLNISMDRNTNGALYTQISINNSLWPAGEFYNPNQSGGTGVHGTGYYGLYGQTTNYLGWAGFFEGDVGSTGDYYYVSDEKWKINVSPLRSEGNALKKIMKLSPKSYNWRSKEFPLINYDPNKKSFGFIAQELKEIFPELVISKSIPAYNRNRESPQEIDLVSGYYMVNYTGLIPILTEAIQQQQVIIESLEKRLVKLEDLVDQHIIKR